MKMRVSGGAKVVVGYPRGGSVTGPFAESIQRMVAYEASKGPSRLLGKVTSTAGLYVGDNRTLITQRFLEESDAEWLLQIDTDIEFPSSVLETMVELAGRDRKILAASLPLGEAFPTSGFIRNPADPPGVWEPVPQIPTWPIEVDGIATTCTLIHRDVFEGIAERHGQCWWHHIYLPASPEGTPAREFKFLSQGEDLAFSARAKDAGFRLWCVHVPGMGHYKTKRLSHDDDLTTILADHDSTVGELVAEG